MELNGSHIEKIGYVEFGGNHSYNDYKMLLKSYDIELPKEKTLTYESPFTDGKIDYTQEVIGGQPKRSNRKIKFAFKIVEITDDEWIELYHKIVNEIHNKHFEEIYLSSICAKYSGKATIDSVKSNYIEKTVVISVDASPSSLVCVSKETFKVSFTSGTQSKTVQLPTQFLYKTSKGDEVYAYSDKAIRLSVPSTWIPGVSNMYISSSKVKIGEISSYSSSVSLTVTSTGYLECNITLIVMNRRTA